MKRQIILTIFLISVFFGAKAQTDFNIDSLLNQYVLSSSDKDAGILVGVIDCRTDLIKTFSKGSIDKGNDLRLVCPGSKPALSYLILKNGLNIQSTIDKWFPPEQGYQKSDKITIKMLLSNTSGINDYVGLLFNCKQAGNAQFTVDTAYKNKELAFDPGVSVLYSNTGFNMAGIILEKETGKTVNELLSQRFKNISPSIRMDDGKGNYPKGYMNPWPYHYSLSAYSGGIIGTIEDYLRMMSYISKQPEFKTMTDWVKAINGWKYGLGIEGEGDKILYPGNSGANLSWFTKIDSKIIYVHTANDLDNDKFQGFVNSLIPLLMKL
ncbi:MAG TPA: serine hydrolase domain-containing protein [Bacteroidales bacterium]|nr:serine hydrolase domain-containing protein [Bacteroidales bacterium]